MTAGQAQASPYGAVLRRLHLAIAVFVFALALTGFAINFREPLGLQDLKLTLVYIHATVAYGFLALLLFRITLGVVGADAVRFSHTLPRWRDVKRLAAAVRDGSRMKFAGRSPLSRTLAGVIYLAFVMNAATGLVRAGTDVYFPPLGGVVRAYVAKEGVDPSMIKVSERDLVDSEKMKAVSRAKIPFGKVHIYGGYVILFAALLHLAGVIATEWSAPGDRKLRGRARLMLFGPGKAR